MSTSNTLAPVAVVFLHEVADWDAWRSTFDSHEDSRKAAGFLEHHLGRGLENPNLVSVYLEATDLAKAKAFSTSLKGVSSAIWMRPVEQHIVRDREVPSLMISHKVSNFDSWLKVYKGSAANALRKKAGIIGEAASQSLDDPHTAIVYHQAESFDALKSFVANPELKKIMEEGGVVGAPQVSYLTTGWIKRYS
jgi:quinol monooxygenase YgiN